MASDVFVDTSGLYALANHRDPARPRALEVVSRRVAARHRFVVMQELGLRDALTADRHFTEAGYCALLNPA